MFFLDSNANAKQDNGQASGSAGRVRQMARGMRNFIAIQMERGAESGTSRDASLAYIKEQIGLAIADAAGRLCTEGQPLVLKPAECVELTNVGYAMQRPRKQMRRPRREQR